MSDHAIKKTRICKCDGSTCKCFDPYPYETKWRASLPMSSPLHLLTYGLMTALITPLVQPYRNRLREVKVQELIKGSTNICLDEMVYKIRRGMSRLASLALDKDFWSGSNGNKYKRSDWFNHSGLPIEYLQDTYDKSKLMRKRKFNQFGIPSGPYMYGKGDRLMVNNQPYVVIKSGNKMVTCLKCPWENKEGGEPFVNWDKCVIKNSMYLYSLNAWNTKKVGEDSLINITNREKCIEIYKEEARIRSDFWVKYLQIEVVRIHSGPWQVHPVCTERAWFCQEIDVWNLTTIPDEKLFFVRTENHGKWITTWTFIMKIVKSKESIFRLIRSLELEGIFLNPIKK